MIVERPVPPSETLNGFVKTKSVIVSVVKVPVLGVLPPIGPGEAKIEGIFDGTKARDPEL